ncbi:hypothetical protein FA95DRAFT_1577799 [Auriscalpium vulgare]|uniref:Uncharacterized protein n=1 Tax=Auriscalpium vulgare TaxID=40419 RepID=A0ACB8R5F7_9AGAM|nr:hypothetical protein FA95DRAFT_1577799 [Auriscalpium vulgare]
MSTHSDSSTPLEAHLLAVLALYEHGPIPESIPAYSGPASPQATEILRAIDALARRARPAAAPTTIPDDWPGALCAPPPLGALLQQPSRSTAEEELRMLKAQVSDVARVCSAIAVGDLQQRITVHVEGALMIQLKDVVNMMANRLESFARPALRVAGEMSQGVYGGALSFELDGVWGELSDSLNKLALGIMVEVRSVALVAMAVKRGDLSMQISFDGKGEMAELNGYVNEMVELLRTLAAEIVRLSAEYTEEGRFDGQMQVQGAQGEWGEMVKGLNTAAASVAFLVREVIRVTTDLSEGKTTEKITINDVSGDALELVTAVNQLVDKLAVSS